MTTALILGVDGQDGTFLARQLIAKHYSVIGVGRESSSRRQISSPLFRYNQADLRQPQVLGRILSASMPDLIFHVAAVHTSAGGQYESIWDDALRINVATVHSVLEHLRCSDPSARLIYASSAKVFGEPYPPMVDETTPIKNLCLYSITKNAAYHLIRYYREHHASMASVVYLFNHESEFRPPEYFIPKVLGCLAAARFDRSYRISVRTLDFFCDWGSAEEYMGSMIAMIEVAPGEDFVLGTGTATFARDFVRKIFERYGLDFRDHVIEENRYGIPVNRPYTVNTEKLKRTIGRVPVRDIFETCVSILEANHGLRK